MNLSDETQNPTNIQFTIILKRNPQNWEAGSNKWLEFSLINILSVVTDDNLSHSVKINYIEQQAIACEIESIKP